LISIGSNPTQEIHHGKRTAEQQQDGQKTEKGHFTPQASISGCGTPNHRNRRASARQTKKRATLSLGLLPSAESLLPALATHMD
jgi:hypothetical protein